MPKLNMESESNHAPLISVYMPTHNRVALLKRAVSSVLNQTYENFELIIVNDGSSDETAVFLSKLADTEQRVRVLTHTTPKGACAARNLAISFARGVYITGIDDDDEFTDTRLQTLLDGYDPDFSFVCHGFYWDYGSKRKLVDSNELLIKLEQILDYNHATNQIFTETYKLKEIHGFDESFPACQDYDTWTRMIVRFGMAKRLSGASYIIHQGHEGPRITAKSNKIDGHALYFEKHVNLMSKRNKVNQSFLALVAARKPFPFIQLSTSLFYGFKNRKIRYFLSSNFKELAAFRQRYLKGKV